MTELSIEKFDTNHTAFDAQYEQKAHLQTSFNMEIIRKLSDQIKQWFPDTQDQPIKIADLCCGHGKPTYDLFNALNENGVNIEHITGYDISAAQIQQAQLNYANNSKINFAVQNIEQIQEKSKYDVIVSFFGLHWMEDISAAAQAISYSLNPNGKLAFVVPLEKTDLFEFRKSFLLHSQWNKSFAQDYTIYPFIDSGEEYLKAFNQYFKHEEEHTKAGKKELSYTNDEFATFLSSWLPEMRNLNSRNISSDGYDKDLVSSIPKDHQGNVTYVDDNHVIFTEYFFSYQGSPLPKILDEQENVCALKGETPIIIEA